MWINNNERYFKIKLLISLKFVQGLKFEKHHKNLEEEELLRS